MAKKHGNATGNVKVGSSVTKSTNYIAGVSGKGPYLYREAAGAKPMSRKEFPMGGDHGKDVQAGWAKQTKNMSGKHGQHGKSTNNNMSHMTGGYLIGKGCRTFKKESYRLAGPKSFGHKAQKPHGNLKSGSFGGDR
jgi:hypothetical protein